MNAPATAVEVMPAAGLATAPLAAPMAVSSPLAINPMPLLQAAIDRAMPVEAVTRLSDMVMTWMQAAQRAAFYEALARFKGEAIVVLKRREVDYRPKSGGRVNYSHANLADVIEAISPALGRNGFSWSWSYEQDGKDWLRVTCRLAHSAGHVETATLGGPLDTSGSKNAIQSVGSASSYLERYTLKAVTGVAEQDDDDDGRGAGEPGDGSEQQPQALADAIARLSDYSTDDDVLAYYMEARQAFKPVGSAAWTAFKEAAADRRVTLKGGA